MAETASGSGTISVVCSCGKKLKAPATAVGKKAKCPKCGNVLTVKPPPPPPAEDDSLDALYDLAEQGEQHAQQQQLAPRCPSCMRELSPGAVLCTNCGYDTRSGKSVAARAVAPPAAVAAPAPARATGTRYDPAAAAAAAANASKKVVDKMAPQGSFLKGVAASIGGAMIGAFVWFLVAWGTGYELYFLVLIVGALAGLGMQWGQEGYSYAGGFMAAGITFVTMILARVAVVIALVVPMIRAEAAADARQAEEERMPDLSQWDERVVQQLYVAERKLQKPLPPTPEPPRRRSSDDDEDEEEPLSPEERQEIAAYQAVAKKLEAMPKEQYAAMVKKLDDEEKARNLHQYVREEILLNEVRVHPSNASSVEYSSADKTAKERIAAMTPAKREEEYKRLHAKHEEEQKKEEAAWKAEMERRRANMTREEIDSERAARNVGVAVGGFVILLLVFGGFKGLIWTLLALGLAYRTASGSVSD